MPIYEYTCPECNHQFEFLLRGSEQAECPTCGNRRLEKQFSVPAAHRATGGSLPVCETPSPASCGLPQCGGGTCGMESS